MADGVEAGGVTLEAFTLLQRRFEAAERLVQQLCTEMRQL